MNDAEFHAPEMEGCPACHQRHTPRSDAELRQLKNRLNRMIGQLSGIGRMLEENRYCGDVLTQIAAVESALQSFGYIILESLAEGGVKVGLPREVATLLAAQTMKGAASVVLETGDHPALLKDAVTTPAGCTIDGILELEEGKLRVTLIKAVVKATSRAGELLFEK
jgi:pyrroline-5-carboxylate reductase